MVAEPHLAAASSTDGWLRAALLPETVTNKELYPAIREHLRTGWQESPSLSMIDQDWLSGFVVEIHAVAIKEVISYTNRQIYPQFSRANLFC